MNKIFFEHSHHSEITQDEVKENIKELERWIELAKKNNPVCIPSLVVKLTMYKSLLKESEEQENEKE